MSNSFSEHELASSLKGTSWSLEQQSWRQRPVQVNEWTQENDNAARALSRLVVPIYVWDHIALVLITFRRPYVIMVHRNVFKGLIPPEIGVGSIEVHVVYSHAKIHAHPGAYVSHS